jgi:LEA14-like dessication related protein
LKRRIFSIVLLSAAFLLSGCAGLRLQSPSVTVANMTLIEASLLEQRYVFKLRIQNPNDMDIPVTGMSFEIKLNDQSFVKGVSNKPVTLARLSETLLEVTAVSDLSGILRQMNELILGNRNAVSYLIKGRLVTGPAVGLDFENSGMLDFPTPVPGEKREGK